MTVGEKESLAREIGLMRTLVAHLVKRQMPFESLTQAVMRREAYGHAREKADGVIIGIRMPGHLAFTDLTDCLLTRLPEIGRGANYSNVQDELFDFIEQYIDLPPADIQAGEARRLIEHFEAWFAKKAKQRRIFIPCLITRVSAPRFHIGSITFEFIDRVTTSDFAPSGKDDRAIERHGYTALIKWMRDEAAYWLARVVVDECEIAKAEEIAELATDLAIVALQIAAPNLDTRSMARLDARRGAPQKYTLSESDGYYNAGWSLKEPGLSIGRGTLPAVIQNSEATIVAIGGIVRSFTSGNFRLPILEQAWCDGAYWFHQALAESIDTIAVAKLETSIEILLRAGNTAGSAQRIMSALSAFFGLEPDDFIAPGSLLSARQFARNLARDRSRILHGTWSTLNARGMNRNGLEEFVGIVLKTFALDLDRYAMSDESKDSIDVFLLWARKSRLLVENKK